MSDRPPPARHDDDGATVVAGGWRFAVVAEVVGFPIMRRQLGLTGAASLASGIAARIAALLPGAAAVAIAHDRIELSLSGDGRVAIDRALATIEAAFEAPIGTGEAACRIELVLGAGAAPAAEADPVRLIEAAEQALGDARAERRPVVRDAATAVGAIDRITLARDLHRAIRNEELFLHYQPKLHVRQQRIASIEALVRWNHPVRGPVSPGEFIPIAEESRDIAALTLWTIRQVIADQATLRRHGHDLPVFINIAGVLLSDARFVTAACALVRDSDARIGFEITETSVIRDPAVAIANLNTFAAIGITVAIDDYGAGLSSLAYLKQLPARELKIDKLFVTQLTSSHRDPLIVRSTIDLAHAMEMEVVAEGVETQSALALLTVMGCDMVQGFLISRPLPMDALIAYLGEDRHLCTVPEPRALLSGWRAA